MSDKKISQLPASTTPLAGTEELAIVQSGDTKKASVDNVLAPTAKTGVTNTFTVAQNFSNTVTINAPGGQNFGDYVVKRNSTGSYPIGISMLDNNGTRGARIQTALSSIQYHAGSDGVNAFGGTASHVFYAALNPVLTIDSSGNLVMNSGSGIDFSADGSAAGMTSELLDDYEEGTWSPVYTSSGGAFATMTMEVRGARYTKIGRQVIATCIIRTDNVDATGASGVVYIDGLPFASAGSNEGTASVAVSRMFGFNTNNPSSGFVQTGTTRIYLEYRTTADGVASELPVSALTTGAVADQNNLVLTATYTV